MDRLTTAIKHLIIINVILFFVPKLMGMDLSILLGLHFPENEHFGFWQYITHMFMHDNEFHLLFNMYGLWAFGTPLEQMWGKNKFLFFYFTAGLGAGLIYTLVNYYQFSSALDILLNSNSGLTKMQISDQLDPSLVFKNENMQKVNQLYNTTAVGASGAVYGVLVAFGMAFPNAKLALIFFPIPIAAKYFIPLMILGDLFFGVTKYSVGNVAHFAHIGGAIIGFLIAWYWRKNQFRTY